MGKSKQIALTDSIFFAFHFAIALNIDDLRGIKLNSSYRQYILCFSFGYSTEYRWLI